MNELDISSSTMKQIRHKIPIVRETFTNDAKRRDKESLVAKPQHLYIHSYAPDKSSNERQTKIDTTRKQEQILTQMRDWDLKISRKIRQTSSSQCWR